MFLIKIKLNGKELPQVLPDQVKQCVSQSLANIQQTFFGQAPVAQQGVSGPGQSIGISQAASVPNVVQQLPQQRPSPAPAPITVAISTPVQSVATPTMTPSQSTAGMGRSNSILVENPPAVGSPRTIVAESNSGWIITPAEKAQYDTIFKAWDMNNTGFITGMSLAF